MKGKILLMTLMAILMASIVYGACTVISPAASAVKSGSSVLFNVTFPTESNITNCTVTGTSALTGDIWTFALYNNTGSLDAANATKSSIGRKDAADWSFSFSCVNSTNTATQTCSRTGVTIDNTIPTCDLGSISGNRYSPSAEFSLTGINATSASIQFGSNAYSMTESASGDVFTYSGNIPQGTYLVSATASDGRNTTSCSVENVKIDDGSIGIASAGAAKLAQAKKAAEATTTATSNNNNAIYLLLGGIVLYVLMKKKK